MKLPGGSDTATARAGRRPTASRTRCPRQPSASPRDLRRGTPAAARTGRTATGTARHPQGAPNDARLPQTQAAETTARAPRASATPAPRRQRTAARGTAARAGQARRTRHPPGCSFACSAATAFEAVIRPCVGLEKRRASSLFPSSVAIAAKNPLIVWLGGRAVRFEWFPSWMKQSLECGVPVEAIQVRLKSLCEKNGRAVSDGGRRQNEPRRRARVPELRPRDRGRASLGRPGGSGLRVFSTATRRTTRSS